MIILDFTPTQSRDNELIRWHLALLNNGIAVDRINAYSGAVGAQILNSGSTDYPGSLRPIPPGLYKLGPVEVAPITWGDNIGKYWVDLTPLAGTQTYRRSAFGIHLDANYFAPRGRGSAGCIVTPNESDLLRVLKWLRAVNKPEQLRVSHVPSNAVTNSRYQINSIHRAWLNTIAWCEGTDGPMGYQTMFTGKVFQSFSDHPRQIQRSGGLSSDAAGKYQFLSTTWDEAARALNLPDFSPICQDLAAMWLIDQKRRALGDIEAGRVDNALDKLSWEWASLPASNGKGRYGQPIKSVQQFKTRLTQNLAR